ncbi:MAG: hypothetical protein J7K26_02030 [Candidatus Aenigmarchaeota archaeon]|nr:hypothetical protein [Candidatus Aenigmarchaeota archaeon]
MPKVRLEYKLSEIDTVAFVLPEPELINRKYWYSGKHIEVNYTKDYGALDFLKETGVYNSEINVNNGHVYFNLCMKSFRDSEYADSDTILKIIDRERLMKDLEEKGYAFLMPDKSKLSSLYKYEIKQLSRCHFIERPNDKTYMVNLSKLQELEIYDTLNKELIENEFPGYYARHFKAQEAIELCSSDNDFRKFMEIFNWQHIYCREVIYLLARLPCQKLTEDDFVISKTGPDELIPIGASHISFRFEDEGDIRYSIIGELDITEGGFAANPSALKLAPKKVA